jgi:hypothetical protein
MEKNQHNNEATGNNRQHSALPQNAPGQQVPANDKKRTSDDKNMTEKDVQHSESSLPQNDNETLGTP